MWKFEASAQVTFHLHRVPIKAAITPFISSPQSLNTLTRESADDEKVDEDPEINRYPERAPSKNICVLYCQTGLKIVYCVGVQ